MICLPLYCGNGLHLCAEKPVVYRVYMVLRAACIGGSHVIAYSTSHVGLWQRILHVYALGPS